MTRFSNALLLILLATASFAQVIDKHTTVRHHRELVIDQPPEIVQAESAIQKNDFAAAETLLKKALATDPNNKEKWSYQAWFDLAFALNKLNRADESISAYRKSVGAKPDVFESNLNLGLMLARTHDPEAEQFLRAATTTSCKLCRHTLKPPSSPQKIPNRISLLPCFPSSRRISRQRKPSTRRRCLSIRNQLTPSSDSRTST